MLLGFLFTDSWLAKGGLGCYTLGMILTDQRFLITEKEFEPAYLSTYRSGELAVRVQEGLSALENCTICPRLCKVNRVEGEYWGMQNWAECGGQQCFSA